MLIDTREPDPEPRPAPRARHRLAACGSGASRASACSWPPSSLAGLVAVALAFGGMFAGLKALDTFCGGWGSGLHDHRQ